MNLDDVRAAVAESRKVLETHVSSPALRMLVSAAAIAATCWAGAALLFIAVVTLAFILTIAAVSLFTLGAFLFFVASVAGVWAFALSWAAAWGYVAASALQWGVSVARRSWSNLAPARSALLPAKQSSTGTATQAPRSGHAGFAHSHAPTDKPRAHGDSDHHRNPLHVTTAADASALGIDTGEGKPSPSRQRQAVSEQHEQHAPAPSHAGAAAPADSWPPVSKAELQGGQQLEAPADSWPPLPKPSPAPEPLVAPLPLQPAGPAAAALQSTAAQDKGLEAQGDGMAVVRAGQPAARRKFVPNSEGPVAAPVGIEI